jgi:hypothetical protein
MVTRVRLTHDHTPPPGTWERTPSPDQLVTLLRAHSAQEHDSHALDVGYYSLEARTSINPIVLRANHPSPMHDRHRFTVGGREPDSWRTR